MLKPFREEGNTTDGASRGFEQHSFGGRSTRRPRGKRRSAILGVVVAVFLSLFAGAPAYAITQGESGKFTLWENDNYHGCGVGIVSYIKKLSTADNCGENGIGRYDLNDRLSSFVNKTGNWWIMYEDINFGGARVCVRPNSHDNNIGNDTAYEDDISSLEKVGTSQPAGCKDVTGTAN